MDDVFAIKSGRIPSDGNVYKSAGGALSQVSFTLVLVDVVVEVLVLVLVLVVLVFLVVVVVAFSIDVLVVLVLVVVMIVVLVVVVDALHLVVFAGSGTSNIWKPLYLSCAIALPERSCSASVSKYNV